MEYRDCGGPCVNTCTKPQLNKDCRGPCFSGCFCPKGEFLATFSILTNFAQIWKILEASRDGKKKQKIACTKKKKKE